MPSSVNGSELNNNSFLDQALMNPQPVVNALDAKKNEEVPLQQMTKGWVIAGAVIGALGMGVAGALFGLAIITLWPFLLILSGGLLIVILGWMINSSVNSMRSQKNTSILNIMMNDLLEQKARISSEFQKLSQVLENLENNEASKNANDQQLQKEMDLLKADLAERSKQIENLNNRLQSSNVNTNNPVIPASHFCPGVFMGSLCGDQSNNIPTPPPMFNINSENILPPPPMNLGSSNNIPPPPPFLTSSLVLNEKPSNESSSSGLGLLDGILNAKLKKGNSQQPKQDAVETTNTHDDLLNAIRNGPKLKSAKDRKLPVNISKNRSSSPQDEMVTALTLAMAARRGAVKAENDEEVDDGAFGSDSISPNSSNSGLSSELTQVVTSNNKPPVKPQTKQKEEQKPLPKNNTLPSVTLKKTPPKKTETPVNQNLSELAKLKLKKAPKNSEKVATKFDTTCTVI